MSQAATVFTPFTPGAAIELAGGLWKKRVLPVGDVEYEGRMLHFTPGYLQGLAKSYNDNAYDQVPFQLADAKNTHTNDPERTRGAITGLSVQDDGLWLTLEPTEQGAKVLRDNPYLGVSARIVENYQRSDGKFYPAAIQHVLGTLDPRIPGLGAWEPVAELSNPAGLVIDLSASPWAGSTAEAAPPADGELTEAEWDAMVASLTDDELMELLGDDLPEAGTAVTPQPEFSQLSATFDAMSALELARQEQDAQPPARRDEDRLAIALNRAAAGTLAPAMMFANAPAGAPGLCGPDDGFGRCASAFHALTCAHGDGSPASSKDYARALAGLGASAELATPAAGFYVTEDGSQVPQDTIELAALAGLEMGLYGAAQPDLDVRALAEGLGLR